MDRAVDFINSVKVSLNLGPTLFLTVALSGGARILAVH